MLQIAAKPLQIYSDMVKIPHDNGQATLFASSDGFPVK